MTHFKNDYGYKDRQRFLRSDDGRERRQERNLKILLVCTALYFAGHIIHFLATA